MHGCMVTVMGMVLGMFAQTLHSICSFVMVYRVRGTGHFT